MSISKIKKVGVLLPVAIFVCMWHLSAQILAPDFVCIKNDTLIWNPTANSCGPFQSYDVYFSGSPQGPFNLLARITDPAQTSFFHVNPGNITWYYYLESNHNCPGQPRLQSDTLDNLSPVVSKIQSVSVEGNFVRLRWEQSSSPEVNAFIIYRTTALGTIPIDTAFNTLEYLDQGANPNSKSENYFVVALDRCGNSSLFDDPHNTVFLQSEFNRCQQTITLRWNIYKNWENPIEKQEIWLSLNGDAPQNITTLGADEYSFVYQNADDGNEYCFYINSVELNTGNQATSNQVCLSPDFVQPMRNIRVKNVSVTPSNDIEIAWIWDTNAELNSAEIENSYEGNASVDRVNFPLGPNLDFDNTYLFQNGEPEKKKWTFSIVTTDQCGIVFTSLSAKPIFLTANPGSLGQSNELNWTAPELPFSDVVEYQIYKSNGGQNIFVDVVDSATFSYSDPLSIDDLNEGTNCYFIFAKSIFTYPDGSKEEVLTRSNISCVSQDVKIYLPNAFAPRGRNQIFKPVISFGKAVDYEFQIYNRWGALVFETNDIESGWNGKQNGKDLPQDVYTYALKIGQPSGESIRKTGWLMLLR